MAQPRITTLMLGMVKRWPNVEYLPIGERAIRCRLTILGVVREDVGECAQASDENAWTSATMQAFKRACSAFGLGRYLYNLPKPWVDLV